MTVKTGDKVRVTSEYAAWYREKHGTDPAFTPETDLIVDAYLAEDRLNVRENRRWYHAFDIPSRFLVSAEPDHTAAVIEAARAVLSCVTIDTPDLLLDALVELRIAIDAYDEAETGDNLSPESEG